MGLTGSDFAIDVRLRPQLVLEVSSGQSLVSAASTARPPRVAVLPPRPQRSL